MIRTLWLIAALAGVPAQQTPRPSTPGPYCGVVISSRIVRNAPGTCDLRLVVQAPNTTSEPLEVLLEDSARRELPGRPWDYFKQEVCVSGTIMTDRAVRYVRVTQASQLELKSGRLPHDFGPAAVSLCDGPIASPQLVKEMKPTYTESAVRQRIEGVVVMDAVVDSEGRVTEARVTQSLHPELDEQAVLALKQWQFRPGIRGDGAPVTVVVEVEMSFKLRDRK